MFPAKLEMRVFYYEGRTRKSEIILLTLFVSFDPCANFDCVTQRKRVLAIPRLMITTKSTNAKLVALFSVKNGLENEVDFDLYNGVPRRLVSILLRPKLT